MYMHCMMDGMKRTRHVLTMSDGEWAKLVGLAARLVRDSELDPKAPPYASRVSPMMRAIAAGDLVVMRPADVERLRSGQ